MNHTQKPLNMNDIHVLQTLRYTQFSSLKQLDWYAVEDLVGHHDLNFADTLRDLDQRGLVEHAEANDQRYRMSQLGIETLDGFWAAYLNRKNVKMGKFSAQPSFHSGNGHFF
jgi:hypothetical protein